MFGYLLIALKQGWTCRVDYRRHEASITGARLHQSLAVDHERWPDLLPELLIPKRVLPSLVIQERL